jgi:hypothetical protein
VWLVVLVSASTAVQIFSHHWKDPYTLERKNTFKRRVSQVFSSKSRTVQVVIDESKNRSLILAISLLELIRCEYNKTGSSLASEHHAQYKMIKKHALLSHFFAAEAPNGPNMKKGRISMILSALWTWGAWGSFYRYFYHKFVSTVTLLKRFFFIKVGSGSGRTDRRIGPGYGLDPDWGMPGSGKMPTSTLWIQQRKFTRTKYLQDSKGGQHSMCMYLGFRIKIKIEHFYLFDNNKSGYHRKQNTMRTL